MNYSSLICIEKTSMILVSLIPNEFQKIHEMKQLNLTNYYIQIFSTKNWKKIAKNLDFWHKATRTILSICDLCTEGSAIFRSDTLMAIAPSVCWLAGSARAQVTFYTRSPPGIYSIGQYVCNVFDFPYIMINFGRLDFSCVWTDLNEIIMGRQT